MSQNIAIKKQDIIIIKRAMIRGCEDGVIKNE